MLGAVVSSDEIKHNKLELLAKFFRGFSDPTRIAILSSLRQGPRSVSQLVEENALSQPNVSNHLSCLKECGQVLARQEGRFVYYELSNARIKDLLRLADELLAENAKAILDCVHLGEQR
jgi:DNA-binding transcriptional ArsR family regulator